MSTEDKFRAAVNVIRNLPKNGSYQPSHDLQLKFYSYFKQATEGPCTQSKPAFWDIVKKAKYEAWKKLGNMSKEDAMIAYVEQLRNIVETMSYNDNVENFMSNLDNLFYESVPPQQLDMVLGPVIERVRSQPGSPLNKSPLGSPNQKSPYESRSASPIRNTLEPNRPTDDNDIGQQPNVNSSNCTTTHSSDQQISKLGIDKNRTNNNVSSTSSISVIKTKHQTIDKLNENIQNIQTDLSNISVRLKRLEMLSKLLAVQRNNHHDDESRLAALWTTLKTNVPLLSFVLLWPIVSQLLILWIQRGRKRQIRR